MEITIIKCLRLKRCLRKKQKITYCHGHLEISWHKWGWWGNASTEASDHSYVLAHFSAILVLFSDSKEQKQRSAEQSSVRERTRQNTI